MEISLHHLSVSFRKFRSALEDLGIPGESMSRIVEFDVAIDQAFREEGELPSELARSIADNFTFILQQIGALSTYLVIRIDEVQQLMIDAAASDSDDSEFNQRAAELYTLLDRFQNLSIVSRVLRDIRNAYSTATDETQHEAH